MTKNEPIQCCHESRVDIPWLVNGTLSKAAAAALTEHIGECSNCQADLALHKQMHAAALGSEVTPMVPAPRVDEIIGAARGGTQETSHTRRPSPRLMMLAASIAVIGVALVLWLNPNRAGVESNQLFETATSQGSPGGIGYVLQLQFDDGVTDLEKSKIVDQLTDAVKWTISDSGDYEVHVQLMSPSLTVLNDYEEHTTALSGVKSAKFTALQLPVR